MVLSIRSGRRGVPVRGAPVFFRGVFSFGSGTVLSGRIRIGSPSGGRFPSQVRFHGWNPASFRSLLCAAGVFAGRHSSEWIETFRFRLGVVRRPFGAASIPCTGPGRYSGSQSLSEKAVPIYDLRVLPAPHTLSFPGPGLSETRRGVVIRGPVSSSGSGAESSQQVFYKVRFGVFPG